MPAVTFFRVLEDAPIFDAATGQVRVNHQSTYRRWLRYEYNSTHNAIPPQWIGYWNAGKRLEHEFDLLCPDGLHTQAALRAFLAAAAAAGGAPINPVAPPGDPISIGELDGTCAYMTREEAWKYVLGDADNPASLEIVQLSYVIEFTGVDLGIQIPEEDKGGMQVKVVNRGMVHNAVDYAKLHGLALPRENEGGEISLD